VTVIAIAGPSGGGKTTLVDHVATLLGTATRLYFDDYALVSSYPEDLAAWLAAGADPNLWRTPQLAADLRALCRGAAILHPDGTTRQEPAPYIVLEEPFGRERQEMAAMIDVVACLDTPLEIALVRRLRRDLRKGGPYTSTVDALLSGLDEYLTAYLSWARDVYHRVNSRALASCDLALDGRQPAEQLAQQVVEAVTLRYAGGITG
jgi:uridine kinase